VATLFIDPHGDDLALFSAFSVLKVEEPFVYIPMRTVPLDEVNEALWQLKCPVWSETLPSKDWDAVYAPAIDPEGHQEHNDAALDARSISNNVISYATYAPRGQRTRTNKEVSFEPWMVAKKLRALSCFLSQIEQESTRPWFTYLLDVREWLV